LMKRTGAPFLLAVTLAIFRDGTTTEACARRNLGGAAATAWPESPTHDPVSRRLSAG